MGRVQTLAEMLIELINPLLLHSHRQRAGAHFHPTSCSFWAGFCGIRGELRATDDGFGVGAGQISCVCPPCSPEAVLHHPVPAGSPARARVVALEDQGGLSHVELRQESAILKERTTPDWVICLLLGSPKPQAEIPPRVKTDQRTSQWSCAPISPNPELRFCSGSALPWQQHSHHWHPQLTNSQRI